MTSAMTSHARQSIGIKIKPSGLAATPSRATRPIDGETRVEADHPARAEEKTLVTVAAINRRRLMPDLPAKAFD